MKSLRTNASNVLGRAILASASVFLTLLVFEGGARLSYEEPWYQQLVAEQTQGTYRLRTSLRDRRYESPKPPGSRRVLFLGDSFTVGQGVPDHSAIFVEIIERRLNAFRVLPGVARIDVKNGGLWGSLPHQWRQLLERLETRFEPDVVIAVFFLRAGTLTHLMRDFFGPIRDEIALRNERSSPYRNLYLYRLFRDRRDRVDVATRYVQVFQTSYFGNEEQTAQWRRAQQNLLQMREIARRRSAVFGLVVFPVLADLEGDDYPFGEICEAIVSFARVHDIPVHNLLAAFRGRRAPELWVSAYDQHPNEKAHTIVADSLLPFVRELLSLGEEQVPANRALGRPTRPSQSLE